MRTPLIAGNWKMNMTIADGVALVTGLKDALHGVTGADAAVCPPFVLLKPIADALGGGNIALGAQDMFWEEKGAFTGQVSGADAARLSAAVMSSSAIPSAAAVSARMPSRLETTTCCSRSATTTPW